MQHSLALLSSVFALYGCASAVRTIITMDDVAGSNETDEVSTPCSDAAGQAVWDKFCEWKKTEAGPPPDTLYDTRTGGLARTWKKRGGIHESTVKAVDDLTHACLGVTGKPSHSDMIAMEALMNWWFKHGDMMCSSDVQMYFGKVESMDCYINENFGALHDTAMRNELDHWACWGGDYLVALVVLNDQLTRNLGRYGRGQDPIPNFCGGRPNTQMYSGDAKAQALTLFALESGMYTSLSPLKKQFLHLVLTHSENIGMQALCLELTSISLADRSREEHNDPSRCTDDESKGRGDPGQYAALFEKVWLGIAAKHYFVVDYFGRQPHRNRYVPSSYYDGVRTPRGWLSSLAAGPRDSNTGPWNTFGDAEAVLHPRKTAQPVGWSLAVPTCPAMTGEEAFKNAAPMQFNDAGLPPPGDGLLYNAACALKASSGKKGKSLAETGMSQEKLHWLD